jgi:hypothetical protein
MLTLGSLANAAAARPMFVRTDHASRPEPDASQTTRPTRRSRPNANVRPRQGGHDRAEPEPDGGDGSGRAAPRGHALRAARVPRIRLARRGDGRHRRGGELERHLMLRHRVAEHRLERGIRLVVIAVSFGGLPSLDAPDQVVVVGHNPLSRLTGPCARTLQPCRGSRFTA